MKLRTLFLSFTLFFASFPALATDLSAPYSPTRGEWLQVALYSRITQTTELWPRRVGVVVTVLAQEQQVAVLLSSSNGQNEPGEQERAFYIRHIQELVMGLLANHEWAKELKVSVHFQ
jgi:hypothetical protein